MNNSICIICIKMEKNKNKKQDNRGDMRKIHVTRVVEGNSCTKFQVYILFRFTRTRDTNK